MNKKKFYVTTPIYYTNSHIHVGAAYTTIAADILARWYKQKGKNVFFLTGTDEHGQKIQEAAETAGKTPKEFVDEISNEFKQAFELLNISYNNFIRTTDSYHEKEVKEIIQKLYDKKYIYKGFYEAYYCVGCEQYKTDSDLIDGKCPLHNKEPELRKEEAYLFKLSAFQDKLLKLIKKNELRILPKERKQEIISFIEKGLKDISISRLKERVYWGIELPFDKKHTCFVWVDAFWNYVSGLKTTENKKKFWPADVQLMAKDIIRVHATIWPAILLALDFELPRTLFVHGYFTINGQKMSKSLGNVISPFYLIEKYGSDSVRYFLMRNIPFGSDGDFSEKALVDRHNNELADKLGNLVSRVSALAEKYGIEKTNNSLIKRLDEKKIEKLFEGYQLDKVLNEIFSFVDVCNEYVQNQKIWETKNKKQLYELVESIKKIGELLSPFMPKTSEKIAKQFSGKIKKSAVLFEKIK
ncbi:MAG: methionine--tRNA ligase [Candidatus Pacearchaeota archaeon]